MNYEKIYNQLVENCKVRGLDKSKHEGYFEIHHIVPRCLGGSNDEDNLVMLTGREHFIAHLLLWKIYPSVKGLAYSVNIMSNRLSLKVNSKTYQTLKESVFPRPSQEAGFKFKDKTGMRINNLTVIGLSEWIVKPSGQNLAVWQCLCDCGNTVKIRGNHLNPNGNKSCGCMTAEFARDYMSKISPWCQRKVNHDVWLNADSLYDLWNISDKIESSYRFSKWLERSHNLINKNSYTSIIKRFMSGWNPLEDSDWLEYRAKDKGV
jgi:hypothetical protein